jgi:hypothetical protein
MKTSDAIKTANRDQVNAIGEVIKGVLRAGLSVGEEIDTIFPDLSDELRIKITTYVMLFEERSMNKLLHDTFEDMLKGH